MALNVSTKGSISSFETLGISIAESHFGMSSARAATIVASCGTIGVIALLSMGYLSQYFSDIQLICGGMVIMASGIMSLTTLDEATANPEWKYVVAIFLVYSIGYPIGHTAVIGLFSKSKWTYETTPLNWSCILDDAAHLMIFQIKLLDEGHKENFLDGSHPLDRWQDCVSPSCQGILQTTWVSQLFSLF
jgi:hypothetical protein